MLINMENNHHTQKMQGYMEALEEEKRKIQVFQRELPLCLELVNQAIEACRQQLSGTTTEYMHGGQSECSEQTSTDEGPVLEEFIPIKRSSANSDEDEDEGGEQRSHMKPKSNDNNSNSNKDKAGDKRKSDWLRSAQLWNQAPDPPPKQDAPPKRVSVVEVKRNGGAFQPFHRDDNGVSHAVKTDNNSNDHNANVIQSLDTNKMHSPAPAAATSSTAGTTTGRGGSSGKKDEKADNDGQTTQRKQRRCWSPELHRRFLQALQQLGGSHAATPKQIRELMKVDGLTNDEVKSHLQKYRLHTRRPGPTNIHPNANSQAPQFLLVGGIWVPPEYAAVAAPAGSGEAAKAAAASGIYAPVSIPPHQASPDHRAQPKKRKDRSASPSEGRGSHSTSGGAQSNDSPSTSSSTHTTTTSPVY